jgi:hypothetical protein
MGRILRRDFTVKGPFLANTAVGCRHVCSSEMDPSRRDRRGLRRSLGWPLVDVRAVNPLIPTRHLPSPRGHLALACLAVSRISLRRASGQLDPSRRNLTVALSVPIAIGVVVALLVSIWSLKTYRSGIADDDAAVERCGNPPVLAWSGYWGHYVPADDSDYDRLKYSADDPSINGPLTFYCSTAEAESHGIHRFAGIG